MKIDSGIFARYRRPPSELHVRRASGGWTVHADDQARPLSLHFTADAALALAHALARQGARVVVHPDETVVDRAAG